MSTSAISIKQDSTSNIYFYDFNPEQANFHNEVIDGLNSMPKSIAPKFFYDEIGSNLFDTICETEDYYPTRTEKNILEQNRKEIAQYIGDDCVLIEPGSGSSQKVRILLETINPKAYMPMDISKDYLQGVAEELAIEYPEIEIHAACVDYTSAFPIPECHENKRKVAFFPGSSIGNFDPEHAIDFLMHLNKILGIGGGLLIGVDLKKDLNTLTAAYNDGEGATAAFNQNLLTRMNDELGANFDLTKFFHHALYNDKQSRIEMHLVSKETHIVSIKNEKIELQKDETIHTENSYKYSIDEFQVLAKKAGFDAKKVWTDNEKLFSVHYLEVKT